MNVCTHDREENSAPTASVLMPLTEGWPLGAVASMPSRSIENSVIQWWYSLHSSLCNDDSGPGGSPASTFVTLRWPIHFMISTLAWARARS